MRDLIRKDGHITSVIHRDDHDVSGKYYIHTHFDDDHILRQTQRLRESELHNKATMGIHDNADLRYAFSCPDTTQWSFFRKKHPETYKLLKSNNEYERLKGAKQLSILHPEWIVQTRE